MSSCRSVAHARTLCSAELEYTAVYSGVYRGGVSLVHVICRSNRNSRRKIFVARQIMCVHGRCTADASGKSKGFPVFLVPSKFDTRSRS